LIGPIASGKSSWAAEHFAPNQIVSSDALRAVVGETEHDLRASADAFAVLEEIVARRLQRRLTTVIDSLGLDAGMRAAWRRRADDAGMACIAVLFDTPPAECCSTPLPPSAVDATQPGRSPCRQTSSAISSSGGRRYASRCAPNRGTRS
jgi:predicted kinase